MSDLILFAGLVISAGLIVSVPLNPQWSWRSGWIVMLAGLLGFAVCIEAISRLPAHADELPPWHRELTAVYQPIIRSCSYTYGGQSPCYDQPAQDRDEAGTLVPIYFRTVSDCMVWIEYRLRAYPSMPNSIRCDLHSYQDGMKIGGML